MIMWPTPPPPLLPPPPYPPPFSSNLETAQMTSGEKSACASRTEKVHRSLVQNVPLVRKRRKVFPEEQTELTSARRTADPVYLRRKHGISDDIKVSSGFSQSVFVSVHRLWSNLCCSFAYHQVSWRRHNSQNRQRSCSGEVFILFLFPKVSWC